MGACTKGPFVSLMYFAGFLCTPLNYPSGGHPNIWQKCTLSVDNYLFISITFLVHLLYFVSLVNTFVILLLTEASRRLDLEFNERCFNSSLDVWNSGQRATLFLLLYDSKFHELFIYNIMVSFGFLKFKFEKAEIFSNVYRNWRNMILANFCTHVFIINSFYPTYTLGMHVFIASWDEIPQNNYQMYCPN